MRFSLRLTALAASIGLAGSAAYAVDSTAPNPVVSPTAAAPTRVLTVALYPIIPAAAGAYAKIEGAFEKANPDIDLQIKLDPDNYYRQKSATTGGILDDQSDVYELDSVLLADFLAANKISKDRPFDDLSPGLVPVARSAVMIGGHLVGVPHWLCGNFLIYRKGDTAIASARTLSDLEAALAKATDNDRWIIIDLKGKSTIGEMYLDAAMDRFGSAPSALAKVLPQPIDADLLSDLSRLTKLDPPGLGRDQDFHDYSPGFYGQQFAQRWGRGLVGYSESLYDVLDFTARYCRRDQRCLTQDDIAVADWPADDRGSHPIAWVDTLVMGTSVDVDPAKRRDAETFIRFMTQIDTYKLLLLPGDHDVPRYLLPARDDLYSDGELLAAARLYPEFRAHMANATAVTGPLLNITLRARAVDIDGKLPPR